MLNSPGPAVAVMTTCVEERSLIAALESGLATYPAAELVPSFISLCQYLLLIREEEQGIPAAETLRRIGLSGAEEDAL